jgi:hypothetical protein
MKYKWKQYNAAGGVSAQVAGEELARLEEANGGVLLPKAIVASAKRKTSPIHNCFEWNDTAAAKAYRLRQAGEMIRKIVVVYEDKDEDETIRAFVSIKTESSYYSSTARILDDDELLDNVRAQIVADLKALQKKWKQFQTDTKLAAIWQAVQDYVS